jgi:hypothetical protein
VGIRGRSILIRDVVLYIECESFPTKYHNPIELIIVYRNNLIRKRKGSEKLHKIQRDVYTTPFNWSIMMQLPAGSWIHSFPYPEIIAQLFRVCAHLAPQMTLQMAPAPM